MTTAHPASDRLRDGSASEGSALPRSLRRLWGMDEGTRPGQKPRLDVRSIARAAISLADEGGIDAVSMSRVAQTLGVTPMALYRYVDSKDELLELMLEVGAGDPPPLPPDLAWRDGLRAWSSNLAAVYRKHPWWTDIPLGGPPRGPHQLAWAEQGMATLRDTTLTPGERLDVVMLVLVYVRGEVSLEQQLATARARRGESQEETDRAFEGFALGLDPERFPQLSRVWRDDAPGSPEAGDGPGGGADSSFGLERILDGVELLVRRRRRSAGRRGE